MPRGNKDIREEIVGDQEYWVSSQPLNMQLPKKLMKGKSFAGLLVMSAGTIDFECGINHTMKTSVPKGSYNQSAE